MSITPEQFNRLVTKDEYNVHTDALQKLTDSIQGLTNAVDNLSKKFENQEQENASNQIAHNRINRDLHKLKEHTGLDAMEVTEPIN